MNYISTVLMALVAATITSGCGDNTINRYYLKQNHASAYDDLNAMGTGWQSAIVKVDKSVWNKTTSTSYLLSDVHYSMTSPIVQPTTTSDTTAVLVNTRAENGSVNILKALEFGEGAALASTENTYTGNNNSWANRFAVQLGDGDLRNRNFDSIKDVGNDSILGWGRWTDSTFQNNGAVQAGCCNNNQSAHYVFGAATPDSVIKSMPRGFTNADVVTFSLIGATSPTLADGSFAPGTLNATTSKVGVLWGGTTALPKIGVELYGTINNLPFTVKSVGGASAPSSTNIVYNPATLSFSGNNQFVDGSKVSGFFAGKDATHIGLTYTANVQGFTTSPAIREVQGAAAFKRP